MICESLWFWWLFGLYGGWTMWRLLNNRFIGFLTCFLHPCWMHFVGYTPHWCLFTLAALTVDFFDGQLLFSADYLSITLIYYQPFFFVLQLAFRLIPIRPLFITSSFFSFFLALFHQFSSYTTSSAHNLDYSLSPRIIVFRCTKSRCLFAVRRRIMGLIWLAWEVYHACCCWETTYPS